MYLIVNVKKEKVIIIVYNNNIKIMIAIVLVIIIITFMLECYFSREHIDSHFTNT